MDPIENNPPPAEGVRPAWEDVPARVRAAVESWLGSPVVRAHSQRGGFSPGAAARLALQDGRRVFVKAAGPQPQPHMPATLRMEGKIVSAMPPAAPVPRLLWSYDEGDNGWVALVFEEVDGVQPAVPWRAAEFELVLQAITGLSESLTPSPLPEGWLETAGGAIRRRLSGWNLLRAGEPSQMSRLDGWSLHNLDRLVELEEQAADAAEGETLLHFDLRADNMLVKQGKVWFVDWPLACVGADWVDVVFFAPCAAMQGGPPAEEIAERSPACRRADPRRIDAVLAAVAGFFTHRSLQPAPAGLPTVRAFQAAQGEVARLWLAQRTGWQ